VFTLLIRNKYTLCERHWKKLRLNDSSFTFEPENSVAFGFLGFTVVFWASLHKEIIQERLEREFNLDLVSTAPNVVYTVTTLKGDVVKKLKALTSSPLPRKSPILPNPISSPRSLPRYVSGRDFKSSAKKNEECNATSNIYPQKR